MTTIYTVARDGKTIGDFNIWELKEGLSEKSLSWDDDYWHADMTNWAKLETIRHQIVHAQKPTPTAPPKTISSPPSLPTAQANPKDKRNEGAIALGVILFIAGCVVLLRSATSDPGNVIQQAVLAQYMTNGILLMILGVLMAKK